MGLLALLKEEAVKRDLLAPEATSMPPPLFIWCAICPTFVPVRGSRKRLFRNGAALAQASITRSRRCLRNWGFKAR